jgi:hypothetical protein
MILKLDCSIDEYNDHLLRWWGTGRYFNGNAETWFNELSFESSTTYHTDRNDNGEYIAVEIPDDIATLFILRWNPVLL